MAAAAAAAAVVSRHVHGGRPSCPLTPPPCCPRSRSQFAINAFQSLENETVRACVLRLVSLPLWHALSRGRLQLELHDQPGLAKHWKV